MISAAKEGDKYMYRESRMMKSGFKKQNKKGSTTTVTSPKAAQANPEQKSKTRHKTFLGLFDHLIPDKKS